MADFDGLDDKFRSKVIVLFGAVNQDPRVVAAGYRFRLGEGLRKLPTQMAYFARGRMSAESVQAMFKAAGLWAISREETMLQVTKTLDSMHLKGLAQDFVPVNAAGKDDWSAPREVWEALGDNALTLGLEWGGEWGKTASALGWDCPHVQVKGRI